MTEDPTGDSDSDLPSADSGETFSDVNSLKERLSGGASDTSSAEQPEVEEEQGQGTGADSGESDGPEGDSQSDSSGGSDTVRMTFHVDRETAERLRNAVYWTATPITLSGTARDALKAAVRQLEEQYNDGEPFPERDKDLKGGNPNLKG
ncbi:hypothetical protein GGQ13_003007 [Salinibacter ruber]|uniref:hypothetical protein n=1 Tax=Salinibacter ruber TaxID=146919 RepID=UPI002167EF87|nr:hypothetical protein [Salinibacter ruber]MCS4139552.1 hypothetical protein [Salinibacter ruber]